MKIIKSVKDIKDLKFGDDYIIDVFPPAEQEDQEVTEEMLAKRDEIQKAIEEMFKAKPKVDVHPEFERIEDLMKIREVDIIRLGDELGLELERKDPKKVNAQKVWEKLEQVR